MPGRLGALADAARIAVRARQRRSARGARSARSRRTRSASLPAPAGSGRLRAVAERRAALARASAPASVSLGHGVSRRAGVRCAASLSIVAPMLATMSSLTGTDRPADGGIPDSRWPGPFPVGRVRGGAAGQAARLRARPADRRAGQPARGPCPRLLRAARRDRGDPLLGLAQRLGRDARARPASSPPRACRSSSPAAATTTRAAPPPRRASPSTVTDLRIAGEGDLLAQIDRLRKQLDREGLLEKPEAPAPAGAAADDRRRHRRERQGARRPRGGTGQARLGGPAGVGLRARPGSPRRAGHHAGAGRPGGPRRGRGGDRRPRAAARWPTCCASATRPSAGRCRCWPCR